MARAKNHMELDGIKFIAGNREIFDNALKNGCGAAEIKRESSTIDYVKELVQNDSIDGQEEITVGGMEIISSLIKIMKKINITGNEFVMFFNDICKRFSSINENIERSFIGEVINGDGSKSYKRKIWLKEKQRDESGNYKMYIIDSESLEISEVTELQMREKIRNGEFVYEKKERQMKDFEMEEK